MNTLDLKPKLFSVIKKYNKQTLMADLMAGIIVGIVALPLAIAFGIASGNYLSTPYMYKDGKDVPYESYMTMSNNTIYITNRNENNILILSGE